MTITVAKQGGDVREIQTAINQAQPGDEILIRNGIYEERVCVNVDGIILRGESTEGVVITASHCAKDKDENGKDKGTFLSFTMIVTGNDVTVEQLTVRNDAGDGSVVGQAVAVYAAGDRDVWKNVRMIAHQDTLFCGPTMPKVAREVLPLILPEGVDSVGDCPEVHNRQYFEDCFIQGDVDFIFGPYTCWFEHCTLYMNARGGYYTAANTPEACAWGLIFHDCRLTGEGEAYLGRPWRAYARTLFLDCYMDRNVHPQGFADWDVQRVITQRCGEYGTTGPRADQSTRHPAQKRLTAEEAAAVTMECVLEGWHPVSGQDAAQPGVIPKEKEYKKMSENVIEKILKAGIGAVMTVAEKAGDVVEDLARKGDEPYRKAVEKGNEILSQVKSAVETSGVREKAEEMFNAVRSMSKEELECLKKVIAEAEKSENAAEETAEKEASATETTDCADEVITGETPAAEEKSEKADEQLPEE